MNFNAENQNDQKILEQVDTPKEKIPKDKKLVLIDNKFCSGIKIMFFSALIAIILLVSGASLYHYTERVNIFGQNIFSPDFSKTFKDIQGNMYDDEYTLGILFGIAILVGVLIVVALRRKNYPTTVDKVVFGVGCIPAGICFLAMIYMSTLSSTKTSGVAGTLSAVGKKTSSPSFAFVIIFLCCLVFIYGIYKAIKHREELALQIEEIE